MMREQIPEQEAEARVRQVEEMHEQFLVRMALAEQRLREALGEKQQQLHALVA